MSTPEHQAQWPTLVASFAPVNLATALVLVDMQMFDCRRDRGWGPVLRDRYPSLFNYYFDRLDTTVLPRLNALLNFWRESGLPVVHLTVGPHRADGGDMLGERRADQPSAPALPALGTKDHAIMAAVAPTAGETILNKITRSAFTSTGLDALLRRLGVEQLVVGGVLTNSCVESTARDATDRGYRVTLLEDGTASFDAATHGASLAGFARIFGAVAGTGEIIHGLSALPQAPTTTTGDLP